MLDRTMQHFRNQSNTLKQSNFKEMAYKNPVGPYEYD